MDKQPVVVGVDGSDAAHDALRWAAQEAALYASPLVVVNARPVLVSHGPGMALISYGRALSLASEEFDAERAGRSILDASERAVRAMSDEIGPIAVSTEFVAGPTIPALLDMSKNARLLVVGSRGLGAFRRGLLGSVSTAVAHHAHCPVAVVRLGKIFAGTANAAPVVVGVDGTDNSCSAIDIAFEEASHRRVELVAVYVWRANSDLITSVIDRPATLADQQAVLSDSLGRCRDRYPQVRVRTVVVEGDSARNLQVQAEHAQLIVVGSHGRGGFPGMTLGSTSEALLHSVECPIIIARKQD
ncbi:universal stress protein [Antrihabitans sp. YC3-6]|uniref:Universal stress protein n=1 Tax=Antrihabitans stalagmiti TaxID=2799499 RepID=A0A934NTI0_9NOCA|nr:universal stress protein [Antrihabitans stalagmiti]MBJ8341263.1 universal stress protein [Antrihabitans stalagmiti]